ncbi:MAG: guanylate kinase [candidate division Zixibacteria bacterium]|nr:guanylate kinase [candidate division Zixibacteria bacterium]
MQIGQKGKIIIISSPSGGGKSSICRRLLQRNKKQGWRFSISYTTRPPRKNERDGREYYFVDRETFARMQKRGEFAESCVVHQHRYGTPRKFLDTTLRTGGVIILDVDVKGAFKLKTQYPTAALVFILPPGKAELRRRLKRRGTEDDKQLRIRRMRAEEEMKLFSRFEFVVVNKDLDVAVNEVDMIIRSLHCRKQNLDLEQIKRIIG